MNQAPPKLRIPGLDGLRGLACLLVFGVHFGQLSRLGGSAGVLDLGQWLANGNTGVALFFSLSGYVLSLPYWRAMQRTLPWPSASGFYRDRAARILPAYFACLLGLVLLNRHWQKAGGPYDLLLHLLLVFNFDHSTTLSINPPFWTLAVEAQFYALLPLLMLALRQAGRRTATAALLAIGLAVYTVYALVASARPGQESAALTYSLLAHAPHFLLGCIAAAWWPAPPAGGSPRHTWVWDGLALLALAALPLILATPLDSWLQVPHGRYNLPYVALLCCALIVAVPRSRVGRLLFETWPLRALGTISYGVYLYHLPLQHVTARLMPRWGWQPGEQWPLFLAISLAASVLAAALSYRLLESPLRRALRGR